MAYNLTKYGTTRISAGISHAGGGGGSGLSANGAFILGEMLGELGPTRDSQEVREGEFPGQVAYLRTSVSRIVSFSDAQDINSAILTLGKYLTAVTIQIKPDISSTNMMVTVHRRLSTPALSATIGP